MNIKDIEEIINDLEVEYLTNDNFKIIYDYIRKVEKENKKLKQERDKYKSIVEEIKDVCETNIKVFDSNKNYSVAVRDISTNILEIIGVIPKVELLELKELEKGSKEC